MVELSVVVPVYQCSASLRVLYDRTSAAISSITSSWEMILVDDSSPDESWDEIIKLSQIHERVRGVRLSRNFGQHPAIMAGLERSAAEWIVVMDCDLQDRPEEIPRLYAKAQEGYDIVQASRKERKDRLTKRITSRLFHRVMGWLTDQKHDPTVASFGCYHRRVIDAVLQISDYHKSFRHFVKWVGFAVTSIDVEHAERAAGSSSYTLRKLFRLAFNTALAFSNKPLRYVAGFGAALSIVSLVVAIIYFFGAWFGRYQVEGWPTIVITIWLLGGLNLSVLGVVGLYVSSVFEQTKQRPTHIVSQTTDDLGTKKHPE